MLFDIIAFFLVASLLLNFFGQVAFYCPCLVIHLKRVKDNRNCLFFCYKYKTTNELIQNKDNEPILQSKINQPENSILKKENLRTIFTN